MTKYCGFISCFVGKGAQRTSLVAKIFFNNAVRFFGILAEVILERFPRFTVSF